MHIHEKRTVWEGSFLRTVNILYEDRSGKMRTWEAVERLNCSGIVTIVPVSSGGDVLMVRQFRPVLGRCVVEFPAGLNDRDESLHDAARRELIEETGYDAEEFIFLTDGPVSSGLSTEVLSVFLAKNISPATGEMKRKYPPDESEEIEVIRTPLTAMYDRLRNFRDNGDFIDLKIYGLAELVRTYLKMDSEAKER